jgi:hypothetical protein
MAGSGGVAEQRQGGAGGADDAEHVYVEDVVPLGVVVVRYGACGADAGVVHQDVELAEGLGGLGYGGTDGGVVGHVGDDRVQVVVRVGLGLYPV